jgi:hypothetical protein
MMLADQIAYVALVSHDPAATASVFERHFRALLGSMAAAGLPMIDTRGRPGSRRALIGFPHPRALGGVLIHLVQRPD